MRLLNQTYVSHVQKSGVVDRHIRELTRDISQTTSSCQCIVILNSNTEYNTIPYNEPAEMAGENSENSSF